MITTKSKSAIVMIRSESSGTIKGTFTLCFHISLVCCAVSHQDSRMLLIGLRCHWDGCNKVFADRLERCKHVRQAHIKPELEEDSSVQNALANADNLLLERRIRKTPGKLYSLSLSLSHNTSLSLSHTTLPHTLSLYTPSLSLLLSLAVWVCVEKEMLTALRHENLMEDTLTKMDKKEKPGVRTDPALPGASTKKALNALSMSALLRKKKGKSREDTHLSDKSPR